MKCLKRFAIFVFTTKTTQSRTQVFLVNCSIICNWAALLTSSVHYGKMLSNLVGNSWLWWIMRGILASQKQRNIILEWIIITFINGYTVFCAVYIVLTHFRQVLAEMNGTIFISRISVMNMTAKRIKKLHITGLDDTAIHIKIYITKILLENKKHNTLIL